MKLRMQPVLYGAAIILPPLLIADVLFAWHVQPEIASRPISDRLVLFGSCLWLASGILATILVRRKTRLTRQILRASQTVGCLVLTLMLTEIGLDLFYRAAPVPPALREPNTWSELVPRKLLIPVDGISHFGVNEIGLRGPSVPKNRAVYRIIAVGSSTTEDALQDDSREWPHLLMQELNEGPSRIRVWVANAGVSGHTTVDNLEVLKTLPIFRQTDAALFVLGQTDMGKTLVNRGAPTQASLERDADLLRRSMLAGGKPVFDHPYYKRLRLYELSKQLGMRALGQAASKRISDVDLSISEWRKRRANSPIRPLPPLAVGIAEYQTRVRRLAQECKQLHLRCIYATQPTIWRPDLSPAELAQLWGGRLGQPQESNNFGYASAADLERAINAWHAALLQVCAEDGLECYDLASRIPKDTSVFYDDAHTTDRGAQLYASALADYFRSRPPFQTQTVFSLSRLHTASKTRSAHAKHRVHHRCSC